MDQRDSHCPYSLSSEITAKPTVLGFVLVCLLCHMGYFNLHYFYRLSVMFRHHDWVFRTTAGQEDPFELDSNLLLSSGRHGEDRKRQYNFIVRPWNTATWRFGWLTVLALPFYSISKTHTYDLFLIFCFGTFLQLRLCERLLFTMIHFLTALGRFFIDGWPRSLVISHSCF